MKKALLVFSALIQLTVFAQTPDFEFAASVGERGEVLSMTVDNQGNVYSVGYFETTTDLNPGPGTQNHTSNGGTDVFIQKLDNAGNLVWGRTFGGSQDDNATDVTLDPSGNLFVVGSFQDSVDFDPGLDTVTIHSAGSYDAFVLKLDVFGNFDWVKTFSGTNLVEGSSIITDPFGNIGVSGKYRGTFDADPDSIGTHLLATSFSSERKMFTIKLLSNGDFSWGHSYGGSTFNTQTPYDMASDNSGNFVTVGSFFGTGDFDPSPTGSTVLSASGSNSGGFALKFDDLGGFIWAKEFESSTGYTQMRSIHSDAQGDVHIAGGFQGTLDFDPNAGTDEHTATDLDIVVIRMNASGTYDWGFSVGGQWTDLAGGIDVGANGDVYITGRFNSDTLDFDPSTGVTNIVGTGNTNMFVAKYDNNSNLIWAHQLGEIGANEGTSIRVHGTGVYTAGWFANLVDFDIDTVDEHLMNSGFGMDGCVMKWNDCHTNATVTEHLCLGFSYTMPSGSVVTTPGTHYDTIPNANGCDSLITVNILVPILNTGTSTSGFEITASSSSGNYQWIDCNTNQPISGETNQSFTATVNGSYAVIVTENGCSDTSDCVTFNTIGLSDLGETSISLFPNPVKEKLTISGLSGTFKIEVVNSVGQTVLVSEDEVINCEDLKNGVYLVKINQENEQVVYRIVKM